MTFDHNEIDVMRYIDNEMTAGERAAFEDHLKTCVTCKNLLNELSSLKEVTDSMKIAELPETVWEKYWEGVYNQLERSIAWFLFILGTVIVYGYGIYQVIIDFSIRNVVELGGMFMVLGFAVLLLSVLREKLTVNKADRYISEVKK
ncbi:anti-sigma factor family protein [Candidatus Latescibacterota bacterium]